MAKFNVSAIMMDIFERLEALDKTVEIGDMGYLITEGENASGSWDCSYTEAKNDICDNWEYITNFMYNYGDQLMAWDPFKETELFHDVIMIETYRMMLEYMVDKIELDFSEEYNTTVLADLLRTACKDGKFDNFELEWLVM